MHPTLEANWYLRKIHALRERGKQLGILQRLLRLGRDWTAIGTRRKSADWPIARLPWDGDDPLTSI
jgi:hypothetical protein